MLNVESDGPFVGLSKIYLCVIWEGPFMDIVVFFLKIISTIEEFSNGHSTYFNKINFEHVFVE